MKSTERWKHDHGEIVAVNRHETLIAEVFQEHKNAKANGDLLAAAPKLLNISERLLQWADYMGGWDSKEWKELRAAVTEAKGGK